MDNLEKMKELFLSEIPAFKEECLKLLRGNSSKMEYKGISGGYGVYAQRDQKSFMIRLRVSSGVVSKSQLHKVYDFAKKYDLPGIHLTTRQAIQLHDLNVDAICDIMEEGIKNNIFTRGGGGNFPRNVGLSPLSGVDMDEAFDVTPYSVATDNYFMSKITTYHLPRKLKVSYSSCPKDAAHCTVQDLGFLATLKGNKPYFRVFVGGGLGKNPAVALELDELINPSEVLYYVEGLTKLFMAEGDYENKNKARVRYMVYRLGEEEFIKKFKEYVAKEKENKELELHPKSLEYPNNNGMETNVKDCRLYAQKQNGYYSVYIHPIGGQLKINDLEKLISELDKTKHGSVRLAMSEGLFIINLNGKEAEHILEITKPFGGCTSIEKSVSCIGVPICQMGIQNSQKMLHEIISYFRENCNGDETILNAMPRIHVSGCMNSCAVHQIGAIGLTGKKKKANGEMTDAFEMFIDGDFELGKTRLGKSFGDFKASDLPRVLFEIGEQVANSDTDFYTWYSSNENEMKKIAEKYNI
ncbi:MAG: nitrite/sulfite reductase [Terrisporobacter sp.]